MRGLLAEEFARYTLIQKFPLIVLRPIKILEYLEERKIRSPHAQFLKQYSHTMDFFGVGPISDSEETPAIPTSKLIQDYFYRLKKHVKPELQTSYHEKGSLMSTKGKADRSKFVLSEKFANGQIKVHWKLQIVIDQIMRRNSGYDILDVLIQLCMPYNIDWEIAYAMFSNKNRNNILEMRRRNRNRNNIKRSKVSGY